MIKNSLKKGLAALALVAMSSSALADNVLSVKGFNVAPGATVDGIEICLDNDDEISSMQFELVLPEGVTLVTTSGSTIFQSTGRISWYNPTISSSVDKAGNILRKDATHYLFLFPNQNQNPIVGNSGAIIKFALKAGANFNAVSNIKLENFKATDRAGDKIEDATVADGGVYANAWFDNNADAVIENLITNENCALVSKDNENVQAVVAQVEEAIKNGSMTVAEGNAAIKEAVITEEKNLGDVNLDGDFDINDVQDLLDAYMETGETKNLWDVNGDGDIDVLDVQELLDRYMM